MTKDYHHLKSEDRCHKKAEGVVEEKHTKLSEFPFSCV